MSKMPAKKKSCFQITSVTTAQAASSITEDTESLDDPDESRTEDVSSEIFDVSRATDFGPEDVVERSSSEETLNNVADAETPGTTSPNVPQEGLVPGARAGAPSSACTSRFRVIKLDHGSGEPYRRGRWTCTEYYDRDSDTIRHTGTFEHSADRDSGLGATGGSLVAGAGHGGHDSIADTSLSAVSQSSPHYAPQGGDKAAPHYAPQGGDKAAPHYAPQGGDKAAPHYAPQGGDKAAPHYAPQGGDKAAPHYAPQGAAMYPSSAAPPPQMLVQPGQSYGQGPVPQNVSLSLSQHQTNVSISQPQQFTYPQSQPGLVMATQSSGQAATVIQSQGTSQKAAAVMAGTGAPSSLPGQHLQAGGVQLLGLHPVSSDSVGQGLVQSAQTPQGHPVLMQPAGGVAQSSAGAVQQKSISQQQVTGSHQVQQSVPGGHGAMTPGLQTASSTALASSASTTLASMPISPATLVQSPLSSHTSVGRSNSLVPTAGLPPAQGTTNAHTGLAQPSAGPFQMDDRRKSEPLPQPPMSLISEKSFVKGPIADSLTNPLHLPVFGLPIPVDGEDDRNPSSAFYEAFQLKFRGSKKLGYSSSANVVAIDNKIEQAMDLVKSHLMYAVREEVEVLKEQIKELIEKNSTLERENALLKSLSNSDQLSQLSAQGGLSTCQQQPPVIAAPLTSNQTAHPPQQPNGSSA